MAGSKKYFSQVKQDGETWTAGIVRRVSASRSNVSKKQDGFASEAEAQAWADKELEAFMVQQADRNKRKSEKRKQQEAVREATRLENVAKAPDTYKGKPAEDS